MIERDQREQRQQHHSQCASPPLPAPYDERMAALASPRTMLVEAVLLGYSLANKRSPGDR